MVHYTRLIATRLLQPAIVSTARVDLNYTSYEGLRLPNGVNAFLGMRYAAPPVGQLRWRAPVEPTRTNTVELATQVCHLPTST
jgi:hypothetical protein